MRKEFAMQRDDKTGTYSIWYRVSGPGTTFFPSFAIHSGLTFIAARHIGGVLYTANYTDKDVIDHQGPWYAARIFTPPMPRMQMVVISPVLPVVCTHEMLLAEASLEEARAIRDIMEANHE